jgi:hypothetical protein
MIFYGYAHFYFAKKYADKRYRKYPATLDRLGKQQLVFPISDERLITCSRLEFKALRKRGYINKKRNYTKYLKEKYSNQIYYKTKVS